MGKFNALLNLRLKQKNEKKPKMTALAEQSSKGNLSSFSGVFRVVSLNDDEKNILSNILKDHHYNDEVNLDADLEDLSKITSEVKAITNQAIILHGERIKKAQNILKKYADGAFSSWLLATYGNRQTPYNFLQYYEFYLSLPHNLQQKMDKMPRQAVYTLASRCGDTEKKKEIVENYSGEPKSELLTIIRKIFPLDLKDKRSANIANQAITSLVKIQDYFTHPLFLPTHEQINELKYLLDDIKTQITKNRKK